VTAGSGAILLGHGDTVMIFMNERMTDENFDAMRDALAKQLPGIKFVVVDSVSGVLVKRKDDDATEAEAAG
jgi:hypothetical protein